MKKHKPFLKRNIFSVVCTAVCISVAVISSGITENTYKKSSKEAESETAAFTLAPLENMQAKLLQNNEENEIMPVRQATYALFIDGNKIAVVSDKKDITDVLNNVKTESLKSFDSDAKADFTQKVEIKEGIYDDAVIDSEKLSSIINTPVEKEVIYTVKDGDSPYSICEEYGISLDEFTKLNGENYDEYMFGGEKLKLKEETKLLTVKVTVRKTYVKTVKFKTETSYDNNDYADNKTVTQKGKNGKTEYTDEISYINGKKVSTKNIFKKVISKSVTEKVTVGTIEHHYGHSNGSFLWPVPNYSMVSSTFGPRWGTNHNGMDIAGSGIYGANIIASDGGTVILSQSDDSGYGMHIIIDHGNGFQTQYAHCSELFVSAGEQVYAGQVIAAVGSTGDSTGPHLHFEIIDNGTKVDPQNYL